MSTQSAIMKFDAKQNSESSIIAMTEEENDPDQSPTKKNFIRMQDS